MRRLDGYVLDSVVSETDAILFGRGWRSHDRQPVTLTLLRAEGAHGRGLRDFRHGFEIARDLDCAAVLRPLALEASPEGPLLVSEDFEGTPLRRSMGAPTPAREALPILITIAAATEALHRCQLTHKALSPDSILVDRESGLVKLTHLGLASAFPRETSPFSNPDLLPLDLAYVSPEQTGRMNRLLDWRTDLYSLGVVFYEVLTGRTPFAASDPLELVHCHLARRPTPPKTLQPSVPGPLSDVVMKLLAKMAEDRYQSAAGLRADLERCLAALQAGRGEAPFELDRAAAARPFALSQGLFGRGRERALLLEAFDRVAGGGTELLLVAGYAGVGKSGLVHEVHEPITLRRGQFISGKFDSLQTHVPYSALARAFEALTPSLLRTDAVRAGALRRELHDAVGANGGVLLDVIPSLEALLGPKAPMAELEPREATARFHYVFKRFLSVVSREDAPLTLFLDDLQWADTGTLALLEEIVGAGDARYLLCIAAYRDNELYEAHPLAKMLRRLQDAPRVSTLALGPLAVADVAAWLGASLGGDEKRALDLAELVHAKTGGNPFFVLQFVKALCDDGLIALEPESERWAWDAMRIRERAVSEDVVEMLAARLERLPAETRRVLALAACLGHRFELEGLCAVAEIASAPARRALRPALEDGYLVPAGEAASLSTALTAHPGDELCFTHDRIHQAAYALVPEAEKAAEHLRIARHLEARGPRGAKEAWTFELATHFNEGRAALGTRPERLELASLNLRAGREARRLNAHESALHYLRVGTELVDAQAWRSHRELAFELYRERADVEVLAGHHETFDTLAAEAMGHARTAEERLAFAYLRVVRCFAEARYTEAFEAGRAALGEVGVELPEAARLEEVFERDFARLRARMVGADLEALFLSKEATSPAARATFRLLGYLCLVAYFVDLKLFRVLVVRAAEHWLEHGHCAEGSTALVWLGNVLAISAADHRLAYDVGRIGVRVSRRSGGLAQRCRDTHLFANLVGHWVEPLARTHESLKEAYRLGAAAGDLQWAGYSWMHLLTHGFHLGVDLRELLGEAQPLFDFLRRTNNVLGRDIAMASYLPMMDLAGRTPEKASFALAALPRARYLEECLSHQTFSALAFHHVAVAAALAFYGRPSEGMAACREAERHIGFIAGMPPVRAHAFYEGLHAAMLREGADDAERDRWERVLAQRLAELRAWAPSCPANLDSKLRLLEAEEARPGAGLDLVERYEVAAKAAAQGGFPHLEAFANERAASFLSQKGRAEWALSYARAARDGYRRWGAARKVADLEALYPALAPAEASATNGASASPSAGAEGERPRPVSFDALTLVKAQHAISGEIVVSRLLETLMRIVLEAAGARRACLLLHREEGLEIAAETSVDARGLHLETRPLDVDARLPIALVSRVAESMAPILVDDASKDERFADDDYLRRAKARSVFCLPILKQAKLGGVLYLENELAAGVFTLERQALLQHLAAQTAISLENAALFGALQRENAERRSAEEALGRAASEVQDLYEHAPCGYHSLDAEGLFVRINETELRWLGYARDEIVGRKRVTELLTPESRAKFAAAFPLFKAEGHVRDLELDFVRKDGSVIPGLVNADAIRDAQGRFLASRSSVIDLSHRKELEAALRQSQKLEAVGRLAGGVAHDFNNLLTVILGGAEFLGSESLAPEAIAVEAQGIQDAAERAAGLTRQLLAFSRKHPVRPRVLDLRQCMGGVERMLRRLIGETIELVTTSAPDLGNVRADPTQIEQILVNLAVNARDAMPEGGRLTFELSNVDLSEAEATEGTERRAGAYVCLAVRDTGQGMSPEVRAHLFEPFFTTKELGRGTGLGLSTVYGIMKQAGGFIAVESELGKGSEFRVCFPRVGDDATELEEVAPNKLPGGRETVLLAEDERGVRDLTLKVLRGAGYDVRCARNGEEALRIAAAEGTSIDLLVTDLVMPTLGGMELAERLRRDRPRLAVLLMSGYEAAGQAPSVEVWRDFVEKPFTPSALLRKARALLDRCGEMAEPAPSP